MILDTICDLQRRGFTSDFSVLDGRLFCSQQQSFIENEQYDILEVHSFDNETSENGETILYGIEWFSSAVRGILLISKPDINNVPACKLKRFWK